jgi:uncharacterized protein YbjT (DUF2867 family)
MLGAMGSATGGTALVAGGTGLVGSACLRHLLARRAYERVIAVGRRAPDIRDPGLERRVVGLDGLDGLDLPHVDAAFCALGTTIANAGSQAAFRRVDFDAVVAFARCAARASARHFVLVSSVGADAASTNFYLRVKGETEQAVSHIGFRGVSILRPSLLIGPRAESRPAEAVARAIVPLANPLLVGPLRRYRSIAAEAVGAAMVGAGLAARPGVQTLEYDDMLALARSVQSPGP